MEGGERWRGKEWILGIAIVEFDVEQGQVVKYILPSDCLTEREQKAISHMSFPDSNSFTKAEGFCQYIFRVKRELSQDDERFSFGFTYFQQRKDAAIQRGYKQQSVVVLTHYPFITFYNQIAEILSKNTFNNPTSIDNIIKQALVDVSSWDFPKQGQSYSFYFLGNLVQLQIPQHLRLLSEETNQNGKKELVEKSTDKISEWKQRYQPDSSNQSDDNGNQKEKQMDYSSGTSEDSLPKPQTQGESSQNNEEQIFQRRDLNLSDLDAVEVESKHVGLESLLSIHDCTEKGYFQEFNIFSIFGRNRLHNLWKLWEIAITNQPLLIVSNSPQECSELVFATLSLISPLEYIGDYRPYFTIYDQEYKSIKEECDNKVIRNIIIGVTNPFFLKTLNNFPVILRLDSGQTSSLEKNSSEKIFPFQMNKKSQRIMISYDKQLEKILLPQESVEVSAINNSLIRKHFRTLTSQFMQTFEDYFLSQKNDIKIFDQKEFLKQLENKKFNFQDLFEKKKRIIQLYEKFIRSANFLNYIKHKKHVYFTKSPIKF